MFSSEFLLEGVMKYLLPCSLLIFPICLYCCSQPASLLEFNSADLVNLCGRGREREVGGVGGGTGEKERQRRERETEELQKQPKAV